MKRLSLSTKLAVGLATVIGVFAVANAWIQVRVFGERFDAVEQDRALDDLRRVRNAIDEEESDLAAIAISKASSSLVAHVFDDAQAQREARADGRHHTRSAAAETALAEFAPARLAAERIDALFLIDQREEDVYGTHPVAFAHLADRSGAHLQLAELPAEAFHASHFLLNAASGADPSLRSSGLLIPNRSLPGDTHQPLLVSAQRVSLDEGGTGTLVVGRFLDEGLDAALTEQTAVDFDFWDVTPDPRALDPTGHLPAPVLATLEDPELTSGEDVLRTDESTCFVYGFYEDIHRKPNLLLRANVVRDVTATGKTAMFFGNVSVLIGALLMLLALTLLLDRLVVGPLKTLTRHAVEIGRKEDFRAKLEMDRGDELGTLSSEFDQMMTKLEAARASVMDSARAAGMSEIATGILHNVGNVLNSVNISASMVARQIDGLGLEDLERLVEVLRENEHDLSGFVSSDPRGRHLLPFLNALSGQLNDRRGQLVKEVDSLASGLEHICDLVKSQQQFAVRSDLAEPVNLEEKLEEALEITQQALGEDPALEIVREFAGVPEVEADKHRLLEIMVNIIQNAQQAMRDAGSSPRRLVLRTTADAEHARIQVQDSGPGIAEDVLARIFNLGFSTKAEGHGYGLHTAANAATEMGGALSATSDGPGEGATFTLEIPLRRSAPTS